MSHDMATTGPGSPNKALNKLTKIHKNLVTPTIGSVRFARVQTPLANELWE